MLILVLGSVPGIWKCFLASISWFGHTSLLVIKLTGTWGSWQSGHRQSEIGRQGSWFRGFRSRKLQAQSQQDINIRFMQILFFSNFRKHNVDTVVSPGGWDEDWTTLDFICCRSLSEFSFQSAWLPALYSLLRKRDFDLKDNTVFFFFEFLQCAQDCALFILTVLNSRYYFPISLMKTIRFRSEWHPQIAWLF